MLVTSRDPFAKTNFFLNGSGIVLNPLSTVQAAARLHNLISQSEGAEKFDEQDASIKVANQHDGLPLATTQLAGFIRRRHLSIREFVDLYITAARYAEVHHVSNPLQDHRYGYTLATAYNFQGSRKSCDETSSVACLHEPRSGSRGYIFLNPQRTKDEANDLWTASTFENARFELLASSVIKRNINKQELWIHCVIQAEVRTGIDETRRYQAFKQAVSLFSGIWPSGDLCSQGSKRWAYLHERGISHEAKAYLKLALTLCDRANTTQEPLASDMHLTMGALSNETNDAQSCLGHNILCLVLRKAEAAKHNKSDLRLAFAHSQMGIAYMMIRKFAFATEYFKKCIGMLKGLDVDVDEFGFPVCNLGLAYWVKVELDAADTTLTDLLLQRERRHGKLGKVSYK